MSNQIVTIATVQSAYTPLADPTTRPPWTDIFRDKDGNPQTKDQLLKRFNGRYDAHDPHAE
jgi:hypothetical protein